MQPPIYFETPCRVLDSVEDIQNEFASVLATGFAATIVQGSAAVMEAAMRVIDRHAERADASPQTLDAVATRARLAREIDEILQGLEAARHLLNLVPEKSDPVGHFQVCAFDPVTGLVDPPYAVVHHARLSALKIPRKETRTLFAVISRPPEAIRFHCVWDAELRKWRNLTPQEIARVRSLGY